MSATTESPSSSSFRTTCGLWMMGPSVTTGPSPFLAASNAILRALLTPKQKPAPGATVTFTVSPASVAAL